MEARALAHSRALRAKRAPYEPARLRPTTPFCSPSSPPVCCSRAEWWHHVVGATNIISLYLPPRYLGRDIWTKCMCCSFSVSSKFLNPKTKGSYNNILNLESPLLWFWYLMNSLHFRYLTNQPSVIKQARNKQEAMREQEEANVYPFSFFLSFSSLCNFQKGFIRISIQNLCLWLEMMFGAGSVFCVGIVKNRIKKKYSSFNVWKKIFLF